MMTTQSYLVLVISLTILTVVAEASPISLCEEIEAGEQHQSCEQTEYDAYLQCVHSQNEVRRRKRDLECPFAEDETPSNQTKPLTVNCQKLNFDCRFKCDKNESCEAACPVCPLNADEVADDYRTVIFEGENGETETFQARIEAGRNVTTIIRLTNIINNTNTIHAPVNVTTTNLNNIHVHTQNRTAAANGTVVDFGLGYTKDGPCCYAVRPKTCFTSSVGVRCQHKRHKTCGSQCKSRIIHIQSRQRCTKSGKCDKKIAYVPEPDSSRCVYTKKWPYVSCGQRKKSCSGCYDHYGYGYENYHDDDENAPDCTGCYDDAFDTGPLYQRGPVLRPYYYHQPPCLLMGTCALVPIVDCGYLCYGDEFVDPAWGHRKNHKSNDNYEDEYVDEEDTQSSEDIEPSTDSTTKGTPTDVNKEDDWETDGYKCKIVSDDGTVEIRNCTSEEFEENPYATSPNGPLDHDVNLADDGEDFRHRRQVQDRPARVHRRQEARRMQELWENDYYVDEDVETRVDKHSVVEDSWEDEDEEPKRLVRRRPKHQKKRPQIVYEDDDNETNSLY